MFTDELKTNKHLMNKNIRNTVLHVLLDTVFWRQNATRRDVNSVTALMFDGQADPAASCTGSN